MRNSVAKKIKKECYKYVSKDNIEERSLINIVRDPTTKAVLRATFVYPRNSPRYSYQKSKKVWTSIPRNLRSILDIGAR